MTLLQTVLADAFWSALAATGFAMLFNVPRRTLWGCALCGALGHALRTLLIEQWAASIVFATLIGAIAVGFVGNELAWRCRAPSPIFTVSGVIPMVPGVFAYRTMLGIVELASSTPENGSEILLQTSINAITVGLILVAIVGGIITPKIIFDRRQPIV